MPTIGEMKPSKFLTKEYVGDGRTLTIKTVEERNVAKEEDKPEMKWCLLFAETDKPMVLGSVTLDQAATILKSQNSDDWAGKRIHVWTDPTIMFGGKKVGGLRLKEPQV